MKLDKSEISEMIRIYEEQVSKALKILTAKVCDEIVKAEEIAEAAVKFVVASEKLKEMKNAKS